MYKCLMTSLGLMLGTSPESLAQETWRVLAVRVEFPLEAPDDETTSGNGTFDLRSFSEVRGSYRFPYDIPPHDRRYFEHHLTALANYYTDISEGNVRIEYEVFPREPRASYTLERPLKEYGNGRTRHEIDERLTQLFHDAILAADAAEGDALDFSRFRAFCVFHPGLGGEAGNALNDIPSAFIRSSDLNRFTGGPIPVDGATWSVADGMLLPEAISLDGRGGLNGTLARFFANQLGLPGLSNFEDDLPAVGDWSLMDSGANNVASAARLGLESLTGDRSDSLLVGFIPTRMLAWSRIRLGWLTPEVITRSDTVHIVAPHVFSSLPEAVKVPISADEYFLLENRVSRLALLGRVPNVAFSGEEEGVWLSVDDYDAFIPGSGLLIWHVDEAVIRNSGPDRPLNSNPDYRIAAFHYRRGISLEEADGLEDIGNVSSNRLVLGEIISLSTIEGGAEDPFFVGNAVRFGPDTTPNTDSNLSYPTEISIEVLSPPGDTMTVAVTFGRASDGWPITGLDEGGFRAPRVLDVDGDGAKEIIRGYSQSAHASAWRLSGVPVRTFAFPSLWTPAVGDLVPGDGGAEELIFADGTPGLWTKDRFVAEPYRGTVVSATPVIARFPTSELTDIWGWSDGRVVWGVYAGERREVHLAPEPIIGLSVGNVTPDPANELVVVTETGRLFLVQGATDWEELASYEDKPVGAPVVADMDRDGLDEIVSVSPRGVVSLQHVGQRRTLSLPVEGGARSPPVLGDLDGDGFVEVLFGGTARLWVVRFNGVLQTDAPIAFPLKDEAGAIEAPAVLADLDDDGRPEIFAGSNGGLLYGLTATGEALPGFPISTGGRIRTSPLVDDLEGDGNLELLFFTDNGGMHLYHLEEIDPSYTGREVIWGELGGRPGNTGRLQKPSDVDPGEPVASLLPSRRIYCYPNPIKGDSARLRFFLSEGARIEVVVINAIGEVVDRLSLEDPIPMTDNEIGWDTTHYASGLYICRVEAISERRSEVRFVKAAVVK